MRHARGPLPPIHAAFRPWVLATVHGCLPLLLRFRLFRWLPAGITGLRVDGEEHLVRCFHAFGAGRIRLLLAVRHGEVDDSLVGLSLLGRQLPGAARRLGVEVPSPCHVHFLFDRGMTLWGGRFLGWVLSSLGGVSIRRGRHPDRVALRQARHLMLHGRFPFAVAPEGATNGHGERIGPLEPGIGQLGLWCVQDLERVGRSEEVLILPIGLRYEYERPRWRWLARRLALLERSMGLPRGEDPGLTCSRPERILLPRLLNLWEVLLERLEAFYGRYGASLASGPEANRPLEEADPGDLTARLQGSLDRALAVAENLVGVPACGSAVDRCRRLEEAIWRWTYREDLPPRRRLSPLQRAMADRAAREAELAEMHMRLAETFVAASADYVSERPTFERFVETALLMHDGIARLRGDGLPVRPRLGARRAIVRIGPPLSVSRCWRRLQGQGDGLTDRARARTLIGNVSRTILERFEATLP